MKYIIIASIIVIRTLDLYLTFLLEGDSLETEASPIIVMFNSNWTVMILSNIMLVIGTSLIIFKFSDLSYLIEKETKIDKKRNFISYLNFLYFNNYHIKNYMNAQLDLKLFLCIFFHILPYIVIIQGIFAIYNNLSALVFSTPIIQRIPQNLVIHFVVLGSIIILILYNTLFLHKRFKNLHV